uniref:Uncharacterized protein n=1 Tax=Glossina austeni TaxID=7395 RepID=A0A1A9URZ2_GLOAU
MFLSDILQKDTLAHCGISDQDKSLNRFRYDLHIYISTTRSIIDLLAFAMIYISTTRSTINLLAFAMVSRSYVDRKGDDRASKLCMSRWVLFQLSCNHYTIEIVFNDISECYCKCHEQVVNI